MHAPVLQFIYFHVCKKLKCERIIQIQNNNPKDRKQKKIVWKVQRSPDLI